MREQPGTGTASCPSCGAPIEFKNSFSVAAVCEYCDTTVTREDGGQALKNLGKISNVVEDASPIQLGARGEAFGCGFEVLGRLQLVHKTGYWNEWYIEWNTGKPGWLAEAMGQYFVTMPEQTAKAENIPAFNQLEVGQRIFIAKKRYTVTEVRMAKATGTQGETPFVINEGYDLPYADLRRSDNGFATLDYSEDPPLVFTGQCMSWRELHMKGFRRFDGWRA